MHLVMLYANKHVVCDPRPAAVFRFWVLGFGFWVPVSGFRVSGAQVLSHNYISTGDDCYALKSGWDKFGHGNFDIIFLLVPQRVSQPRPATQRVLTQTAFAPPLVAIRSYA